MGAHSTLGGSIAKRFIHCPGSVRLSEQAPPSDSTDARTGTAAHALNELCFTEKSSPRDYEGRYMLDGVPESLVDDDMIQASEIWLAFANTVDGLSDWAVVEKRVDFQAWASEYPVAAKMFGTADFLALRRKTGRLMVADYKHGVGVVVEADTEQLKYYGMAALLSLSPEDREAVQTLRLVVVQPRANHPDGPVRHVDITREELTWWGRRTLMAAALRTESPNAPLNAGDWCKFCPAAGICPEIRDAAMARAELAFAESGAAEPETPLAFLEPADVKQILDNAKFIRDWLKAVEDYAVRARMTGELPDEVGYKLVKGRAIRKWRNEQDAAQFLAESGAVDSADLFTDPKLKSPAQIEKLLPKELRPSLAEYVSAETDKLTLVPMGDKRPEVQPRDTPEDAFAGVDAEMD